MDKYSIKKVINPFCLQKTCIRKYFFKHYTKTTTFQHQINSKINNLDGKFSSFHPLKKGGETTIILFSCNFQWYYTKNPFCTILN